MAVIETYEEHEDVDCALCPEPVVRLDEVVTIGSHLLAHAECFVQVPLEDLATLVRTHRSPATWPLLVQGAA